MYNDDFSQSVDEYKENSGQTDEEGNRLVQNTESNGRFHTDWLNMIYPRLKVAKDLLSEDGVIFISIGEQEIDNLKKCINEIFGQSNNIETYIWESTFRPDNSSSIMRRNAEYIVCFAKNIVKIDKLVGEVKKKEGLPSLTKNSMKESILKFPANIVETYLEDGIYGKGARGSYDLLDDVEVKDGRVVNDFRLKGRMIWGQENLNKEIASGTKIIIKGDGFVPYTDKGGDSVMSPTKIIPNKLVGDVLSANAEMSKLFTNKVFPYPKPLTLIKYLLSYFIDKEFIVLDFFSGSATTAHAVMQLNAEDGGNRKFIMVQLPERTDAQSEAYKARYNNICEIGKERIRRAGRKIKEEAGLQGQDLDIGFRVLKLDSSNMEDVYYTPREFTEKDLFADNVKEDRTAEDLLFQVMLDLGVELSAAIEQRMMDGKQVSFVNGNYLVACFDTDIAEETIKEIAKLKPYYFVMRDSSLASDNVADNFDQLFETYSKETIRRII